MTADPRPEEASKADLVHRRLREEVDEYQRQGKIGQFVSFKQSQEMPYLQAVIKEALRMHPATGLPLERVVPAGGATIAGQFFPEGVSSQHPTPPPALGCYLPKDKQVSRTNPICYDTNINLDHRWRQHMGRASKQEHIRRRRERVPAGEVDG